MRAWSGARVRRRADSRGLDCVMIRALLLIWPLRKIPDHEKPTPDRQNPALDNTIHDLTCLLRKFQRLSAASLGYIVAKLKWPS